MISNKVRGTTVIVAVTISVFLMLLGFASAGFAVPVATSVTPALGPVTGGTVVTIAGTNFGAAQGLGGVTFGGFAATIAAGGWSNTSITCTTPNWPGVPGPVNVVVTDNLGVVEVAPFQQFTYDNVTIATVTPALGSTAGGTSVTIVGTNFGPNLPGHTVKFGLTTATINSWTDTNIVCLTPPHAAGTVDVVVTRSDGGGSATVVGGFTFANVTITSPLLPNTAPTNSGLVAVTINGLNFGNFVPGFPGTVTFGGTPTLTVFNAANWTDNQITCTAPNHAAGAVDVIVTRGDGGGFGTLAGGFTYFSVTVTSVTPAFGPTGAGTAVTVAGTNFGTATGTVQFDGVPAVVPAGGWGNTSITCTTPFPHAIGKVDVVVIRNGDLGFGTLPNGFAYGAVNVVTVAPAIGPVAGGTLVTLNGTGFGFPRGTGSVTFGVAAATFGAGTSWTDLQIVCRTPGPHAAGPFDVVVTNDLGIVQVVPPPLPQFTFFEVIVNPLTPASPNFGPTTAPTAVVTITGTNFGGTPGGVTFGGASATIIPANWTDTQIVCTTPPHAAGFVDVVVTRSDGISGTLPALPSGFHYIGVSVSSVTPNVGPVAGLTPVTIDGTGFGFTPGTVFFGASVVNVPPGSWSDTQIAGTTTPGAAGAANVVVTRNDGIANTAPFPVFTYFNVTITSVATVPATTPPSGTIAGGTSVVITGTNFGTVQGTVTFDGTPATIAVGGWTNTSITCTTPAHAATPAPINVVVTRSDLIASAPLAGFTYGITFTAPLAPVEGPVDGNTVVTITGTNFGATQGSGSVTFGGTAATITNWTNTVITCTTNAHAAGLVNVVVTRDGGTIIGTLTGGFFYGVTITSVTPNVGPVGGGLWVDIVGANFGGAAGIVTFGGAAATFPAGSIWSDTLLRCMTPAHLVPGAVNVVVTKAGLPPFISGTSLGTGFPATGFYYGVVVASVTPPLGPITGGTTVNIVGNNFGPAPAGIDPANVRFGGILATITSWTNMLIVCVTPAHVAGAVDVVVKRNDDILGPPNDIDGVLVNGFFYGVGINSVTPNVGRTGNPPDVPTAVVTITGNNFGTATGTVTFGGVAATSYTSWSDTQIVCTTPPHAAGPVSVVVTRSDGVVAGTSPASGFPVTGFFYGVVINSVVPNVTPVGGGPVDIYGQNFGLPPGTANVTFGGILATGVVWVSNTHIICNAPPRLVPGAVDVVVTRNDGLSGTLPGQPSPPGFYYGVTVTSVTPNVGPIAGGTVVTIVGDNFGTSPGPGGGVTFGFGFPATDYVWTNTSITCVVPAWGFPIPPLLFPGFTAPVDVLVTRNDGVTGVMLNGFTYGVGITSVTPAIGPTGLPEPPLTATVTIAGGPFGDFATAGAGTVMFGGIPTTTVFNATNWTNTQIVCKTPPHVAGPVNVVVTRHDGAADGVLPAGFFYGIVINTVTPNVGSEVPPLTSVTITGDNFGPVPGTGGVTFGGIPAVITAWAPDLIICDAPAHAAGPVNVVVTRDGGISATVVNGFTYGVTINTVDPPGGPVAGSTVVTISGANFGIIQGNVVFGVPPFDPPAAITSWSDTQIVCVTPPRILGPGFVDVRVTRADGTIGIKPLGFFYGIVTVASVAPALGPVAGNTPVTIIGTNFGAISGGVTFGGTAAPITTWTDTQIVCVTPAHAAGVVDVRVTRTGGIVFGTLPSGFIYGAVTVTSVLPALGPIAGGTSVTIAGTNFGTPAGTVTLGGAPATITGWTNTSITCVTPAHAAGLVDVVVTRNDGAVPGTLLAGFLYGAVTITSVTPSLGPVVGGTSVTIAGTNFGVPTGTVSIGGNLATIVSWTETQIVCVTPAGTVGPVPVVVTRADGAVPGTLAAGFTYGVVTVASVTPNVGPTGGGTSVTIAGTNFGPTAGTVTFDSLAATDVVWGATITCKTPAHAVGPVAVAVTRGDGGGSGTLTSGFTYQKQFVVFINGVEVSPTTRVPANANVNFSVEVWINGITSAKLFYKKGGEASYSPPITLSQSTPWTWGNSIPAINVTARGLLYYVEVNGATHLFYPGGASAPAIPANISVYAPSSFAFYTTPPPGTPIVWNMIAPNGDPDDTNLRTVVGPVFNEGGGGTWIAWGYNPSAGIFVRLPNTTGTFIAGQSWFFAKDGSSMLPQAVPFSSTSVDASVPFPITLQPGWNLIANPFAFPVAWSDTGIEIRDSADNPYTPTQANIGGIVSDKVHWLNPATGSYTRRVSSEDPPFTMMPNQGEWLFSGVAGAKMLIKPIFHAPTAIEAPAAPKKDMTAWEVTLSLQSSTGSDSVTAAVGKSTGKVELNQIKSPGMPLAPYIAFTRDEQVGAASMLSSDVRAINDELTWSIKATASSEVSLDWSLVNVPDDYMLSLEDQAGKVVNLRQDSAIHLGVGVYSFILKAEKKALIPKATKLLANYPNPFNPETWIPYELSKDTDVAIKIYASNGQLVRSLELGHKMAGFYSSKDKAAHWDGKNEAGEKVSSGIYFYNIQAGDYKDIRKMVIVQ